jgi:hypothetical protein
LFRKGQKFGICVRAIVRNEIQEAAMSFAAINSVCPTAGCASGMVCVVEIGGVAGGGGADQSRRRRCTPVGRDVAKAPIPPPSSGHGPHGGEPMVDAQAPAQRAHAGGYGMQSVARTQPS